MENINSIQNINSNILENQEKLSIRVLVADDFVYQRMDLEMSLKEMGCEVTTFENGKQLLEELNHDSNYDLVITDNNMPPFQKGIEVLEDIRSNEKTKNIPVIVLTADGNSVKLKTESLGGVYMSKPFSENNLFNVISKIIKKPETTN